MWLLKCQDSAICVIRRNIQDKFLGLKKKKRQGKEQYREYYLILMYKCLQRQYLCNDTQEAGGDGCLCGKEVRLEFGVGSRLTFHFYTF